jgi:hypothetical protein
MLEPDFTDETLSWSSMRMGAGKAFSIGQGSGPARWHPGLGDAPVGKRYMRIGEQPVLIESVEYQRVEAQIQRLRAGGGPQGASLRPGAGRAAEGVRGPLDRGASEVVLASVRTASPPRVQRVLPARPAPRLAGPGIQFAKLASPSQLSSAQPPRDASPSFILDFETVIKLEHCQALVATFVCRRLNADCRDETWFDCSPRQPNWMGDVMVML